MIRALALSVAFAFFACLTQVKAAEPANTSPDDTKKSQPISDSKLPIQNVSGLWPIARIVNDLAEFDIASLSPKTPGARIVARIQPGGLSGGGFYSPETGLVIQAGGQWKLIELLSGKAPRREGRFQWQEPPPNDFDRNLSMLDMSSVFTSANIDTTVICQFFEDKSGAEQFAHVTSIPDDWTTFVKPAHERYLQHAADFSGNDLNELRNLASGENPFLALKAIDHLVRNSSTNENVDSLVDLACSLPRYRQAVLIVALMNRNGDNSRKIALKAIDRAKSIAELTGMALGLYTWSAASHGRIVMHSEASRRFGGRPYRKIEWRSMSAYRSFREFPSLSRKSSLTRENGKPSLFHGAVSTPLATLFRMDVAGTLDSSKT